MKRLTLDVVVLLASVAAMTGQLAQNEAQAAGGEKMSLSSYLTQLGKRFDCYFTVEQDFDGTAPAPEALCMFIEPDTSLKAIADVVPVLGKQLEGFEVVQSPDNPAVFHIVALKAKSIPAYWLDKRVDLSFQGLTGGLLWKIVSSGTGVIRQTAFSTDDIPWDDATTKVTVTAKGLAARSILTDFLPLSRYSRLLWSATTTVLKEGGTRMPLVNGKAVPVPGLTVTWAPGTQEVSVSWGGLVQSEEKPSNELVPFSAGEVAFHRNVKSPEAIAAAVDYINAQMKTENPFQVRWAMFYLGKQGVPEAVPLFTKHLTYKYTTCGVLEESYPAALALSMMGKIGSAAALKAIGTETDSLRLKLLCRVVLLVEGQDNGAKAIEAEVVKTTDAQQNQRIRDALKAAAEPQVVPQAPAAK
jgi:hypothetical protein